MDENFQQPASAPAPTQPSGNKPGWYSADLARAAETLLFLVLAAVIIAWVSGGVKTDQPDSGNGGENGTATKAHYISDVYGFEFEYPTADFTLHSNQNLPGVIPPCDYEDRIVCVYYSGFEYQNTNFVSAGFQVKYDTFVPAQFCGREAMTMGVMAEAVTINGTVYLKMESSQGAAGSHNNDTVYAVYKKDRCVYFISRIAESNYENYDPNLGVERFDSAKLEGQLAEIMASVKFK
jgi:hypothetical protein